MASNEYNTQTNPTLSPSGTRIRCSHDGSGKNCNAYLKSPGSSLLCTDWKVYAEVIRRVKDRQADTIRAESPHERPNAFGKRGHQKQFEHADGLGFIHFCEQIIVYGGHFWNFTPSDN